MEFRAGVVTVSDKGSRGEREDLSGKEVIRMLQELSILVTEKVIIPDEKDRIRQTLTDLSDEKALDLIVTTGGTGVTPRDLTPDATLEVIDRALPGMAEAMRQESLKITPHAMISRAVAAFEAGP
jgi:molybdenum cofactor synthesis domain-containing protein